MRKQSVTASLGIQAVQVGVSAEDAVPSDLYVARRCPARFGSANPRGSLEQGHGNGTVTTNHRGTVVQQHLTIEKTDEASWRSSCAAWCVAWSGLCGKGRPIVISCVVWGVPAGCHPTSYNPFS